MTQSCLRTPFCFSFPFPYQVQIVITGNISSFPCTVLVTIHRGPAPKTVERQSRTCTSSHLGLPTKDGN